MNSPGQQMPKMLQEISGEITQKNKETEPKQKQYPAVDMTGVKARSNAVKSNIAQEPEMSGP